MNSTAGEPQRDRARVSPWLLRYKFPQLKLDVPAEDPSEPAPTLEERRWMLRGEPRTRATFGAPHPDDFSGGLPIPPEYPPAC